MAAIYYAGLALIAIGSGLVIYGALSNWTPEQPLDYPKEGKRWK